MKTINLKKYYYPLFVTDTFIEVSDEVAEALLLMRREENNRTHKIWYHKAYYSLDCEDGIENCAFDFNAKSPDEILLVDRMGKRYVRATRKELKNVLPKKADFAHLEKLLYAASKPNGKKVLTGKELGIPSLEKGKIELSNFSDKPFVLTPTQLSQKYKEVELEELLEMLMDL